MSDEFTKRQKQFYDSSSWRDLREQYAKEKDYICERCHRACYSKSDKAYKMLKEQGQDVLFGIVHHKKHLDANSIEDASVALNWDNLELLCIRCHNQEHIPLIERRVSEIREDVKFDDDGNIII